MDGMNNQYQSAVNSYQQQLKKAKRSGRWQGALITAAIAIFVALIVLAVVVVTKAANGSLFALFTESNGSVIDEDVLEKADAIKAIIDTYYLEEVDTKKLEEGVYKGLVDGLEDPYSVYYTQEEYKEMIDSAEGVYYGIGAYLQQDVETMYVRVVRPIKGSPAEKVGLLADDIIVSVDGEDIMGQDLNLVVSKIRGEVGTTVKIGVAREGEDDYLYFDITRAEVESETVTYEMLEDEIGYIMLSEFDDVSTKQFTEAMEDLKSQGMKALIFDLRDNGGGNVDTSIEIADYILPEGLVMYMEDKSGNREEFNSDASHHWDRPIVVLANGNSASASEILIGALKDYDRCTLVGTQTFGKGIVQQILPLGDGSGIKVTTAKYYSPDGVCIHGEGFEPDVEVELDVDKYLDEDIDTQLEKAIEVIKEKM